MPSSMTGLRIRHACRRGRNFGFLGSRLSRDVIAWKRLNVQLISANNECCMSRPRSMASQWTYKRKFMLFCSE